MKFHRVEMRHVRLEMARPFNVPFGRFTFRDLVILRVESDVGGTWAEAPSLHVPYYSYETTQTTLHVLRDFLLPDVLGRDLPTAEALHAAMDRVRGHPIAKSGLDTAWHHLAAAAAGKSLSHFLGGTCDRVPVGISVGIEDGIDELVEFVGRCLERGYARIKIKIKPGWDVEPVAALRRAFGDIPLMADANSSYTLGQAQVFRQLDCHGLMMIEQPLGYDDIYQHSQLQKQIDTPICLDESIHNLSDAEAAVHLGACRIVNIKLSRVGGLWPSVRIHDLCQQHGVGVWSGGMFESAIGKADSLALASLPNFKYPADIAPSDRYFKQDLISPFIPMEAGTMAVPTGPGLGFEVDREFLERCTLQKISCG